MIDLARDGIVNVSKKTYELMKWISSFTVLHAFSLEEDELSEKRVSSYMD